MDIDATINHEREKHTPLIKEWLSGRRKEIDEDILILHICTVFPCVKFFELRDRIAAEPKLIGKFLAYSDAKWGGPQTEAFNSRKLNEQHQLNLTER